MMTLRLSLAAAAAASLLFAAGDTAGQTAAAPPGAPSADEFLADAAMFAPELSPSGRYVAFARYEGGQRSVIVYDLETQTSEEVLRGAADQGLRYNWIDWKDENRILVSFTVWREHRWNDEETGSLQSVDMGAGIVALDRVKGGQVHLLSDAQGLSRFTLNKARVLDLLRNDPDHVLMLGYTRGGRPGIWKVDIRDGTGVLVEEGTFRTDGWETDRDGNIVARWDSSERRGGWLALMARAPGQTEYVEAFRMRAKELDQIPEVSFVAKAGKPGQLYALVRPKTAADGDTTAVHVYDFATRTLGPAIWRHPTYDASGLVIDTTTYSLRGGCYIEHVWRCDFLDPRAAATFKGLNTFFKGDRSIVPVSSSRDQRRTIFRVSGPEDPGTYYLYDWDKKDIQPLGLSRPKLTPARLGRMQRVSWTARDGKVLSGYLTLPPGAPAGRLPLVVMPHGGPEARDSYGYDLSAQFLATRGYAVFQPNFRGSYGFGRAFAEAGYGQWGGLMQTDVEDGVQHLIDSGRVDAARMCMFGGSYGGYVALYAGASQPDRYRCVASFAGVSNLAESVERDGRYYGRDSSAYAYWLKSIGDPRTDRARLDSLSPAKLADRFKAPVLLVHGDYDRTVVVDQSKEMEKALRRAGKDVKLVILKEEGHGGWRDVNHRIALTELEAFLKQHLGPGVRPTT